MAELEGTRNGTIAAPAMAGAADAASRRSSFNPNEIAEMERNDRRDGWLLAIFALAALGSAALAFVFFSGEMDQNDSYLREQGEEEAVVDRPFIWGSEMETQVEPETVATESASEATEPRPSRTAAQRDTPAALQTPPIGPDRPVTLPTASAKPPYAGPPRVDVGRETQRALRTGKAQLWNENGERGYVLVSGAVAYGRRNCRQVSYSRFVDGGQETSLATQWCREGRLGRWREDARGPE